MEEREYEGQHGKADSKQVDVETVAPKFPGTKLNWFVSNALKDHEDDRKEVRREVTCHDQRYNGIECNSRADVNQTKKGIDNSGKSNGPDGNLPLFMYLTEC